MVQKLFQGLFRRAFRKDIPTSDTKTVVAEQPKSTKASKHVGDRRIKSWWDPIFNPQLANMPEGDWDFSENSGPVGKFLSAESLMSVLKHGRSHNFDRKTFENCDIQGDFDLGSNLLFTDCKFIGCDFAWSTWKDANFRNCEFEGCSIALATFRRCEFRNCRWTKLGISGSKTEFERTFITNPEKLIAAAVSKTKNSNPSNRDKLYQWHRLQSTKSHLSRNIFLSHSNVGDSDTFYRTVKIHDKLEILSKLGESMYNIIYVAEKRIKSIFIILSQVCHLMLQTFFGLLNGWGAYPMRPLIIFILNFIAFAMIYKYFGGYCSSVSAWQKSFDISILAGYTNQNNKDTVSTGLVLTQNLQALISIILYTVFFSTVVSKLSRVR